MEDTLKRLLDAEVRAEQEVDEAKAARTKLVKHTLDSVHAEEQQFEARLPELHADFLAKAETRAQQTIGELKRRYEERTAQLRDLAHEHEQDALNAALRILTRV